MAGAKGGLDVELAASGFKHSHQAVLEQCVPFSPDSEQQHSPSIEDPAEGLRHSSDSDAVSNCESQEDASGSHAEDRFRHRCSVQAGALQDTAASDLGSCRSDGSQTSDEGDQPAALDQHCSPPAEDDQPRSGPGTAPCAASMHELDASCGQPAQRSAHSRQHPLHSEAEVCRMQPEAEHHSAEGVEVSSAADHSLERVRRQLAGERKSQQRYQSQARAAKGARQAAARKGRKAVSQSM